MQVWVVLLSQHSTRLRQIASANTLGKSATLAGQTPQVYGDLTLSVGSTDIHVEDTHARAVSQVTLTGTRGGELRRDQRNVRFELKQRGGEWRVSAIDVEAKSEAQPEA